MAVSTYCARCGVHLTISKGVAHAPYVATMGNFRPKLEAQPEKEKPKSLSLPRQPDWLRLGNSTPPQPNNPEHSEDISQFRDTTKITEKTRRDVTCPDCEHLHRASARSSSTLCPNCGIYISLKDYVINKPWSNPVNTQGSVRITKRGKLQGSSIKCQHLTLEGSFQGGVNCTGDFIIRSSGKLMGHVRCKTLKIEKRAKVAFLNGIHAESVTIDGLVSADITCKGKLSLLKKAILTGDINVGSLTVEEGAQHHGQVSMKTS